MKDKRPSAVTIHTDEQSLKALIDAIEHNPSRRAAWRRLWTALLAPTDENNVIETPQPSGEN